MNFEIELDDSSYIYEDETLQDAIVRMVSEKISTKMEKIVTDEIIEKISIKAETILDTKVENLLEDFINTPIVISDGYRRKEYDTLLDMIKEKMSETYQTALQANCSTSENVLIKKIKNTIEPIMRKYTEQADKLIKREAEKIAKETLENSKIAKYINTIEITK